MTSGGRRVAAVVFGAALLCAWCGWVSGYHRATLPARVTWAVSLSAVVVFDLVLWRGRRRGRFGLRLAPAEPWPRDPVHGWLVVAGVSPWMALALAVAAWDVLGLDTGAHRAHLTISALSQTFRALDAATLLAWMLVGFGYGVAKARALQRPGPVRPAHPGPAPVRGDSAAPGVVAFGWLGSLGPARPPCAQALLLPSSRPLGVGFWLAAVLVAAAIDLIARRSSGQVATAEETLRLVTGPPPANLVLVVAWAYAGYHLFAH